MGKSNRVGIKAGASLARTLAKRQVSGFVAESCVSMIDLHSLEVSASAVIERFMAKHGRTVSYVSSCSLCKLFVLSAFLQKTFT